MKKIKKTRWLIGLFTLLLLGQVWGQNANHSLRGRVFSAQTKQPVDFATIVILKPIQKKVETNEDGSFSLNVPGPGKYEVYIKSDGLRALREIIEIQGQVNRDFVLQLSTIAARRIVVVADKAKQKLSRQTMTSQQIKDTPAAFGDGLAALTLLPGITRQGIFGSLVIRGAAPSWNQYIIDDIPVQTPQHFFGIHSIISTNLMQDIDVYSSAFPAQYGFSTGAIIDINTRDQVKEFGGYADVGLISTNALVETPILGQDEKPVGYSIVSGRVGYIPLIFPLIELLNPDSIVESAPEYYDYQAKLKFFFNKDHAIRAFVMGYGDRIKLNDSEKAKADRNKDKQVEDPLLLLRKLDADKMGHYQALYYEFTPSIKFTNTLLAFSSLNTTDTGLVIKINQVDTDFSTVSKPNIFGIKNKTSFEYLPGYLRLNLGFEYRYYDFYTKGVDLLVLKPNALGFPDPADSSSYTTVAFERRAENQAMSGYAENIVTLGGFRFVPAVRADYLNLNDNLQINPRALMSYEFETETTISVAAGRYSQFLQTNPFLFDFSSQTASVSEYKPERAWHYVAGVEQKWGGDKRIRAEGFYNTYHDLAFSYQATDYVAADGSPLLFVNNGNGVNYGFELLFEVQPAPQGGFYGQVAYTFTRARVQTGVPNDVTGQQFVNSEYEQNHAVDGLLGYRTGPHSLSGRLSFQTSFPYTNIIGDDGDPLSIGRYGQVLNSTPNTEHFEPNARVDLRYSFRESHSWGYVSWYFELIGIESVFYRNKNQQQWRFDQPYASGTNPQIKADDGALPFLPNFGVEVKF